MEKTCPQRSTQKGPTRINYALKVVSKQQSAWSILSMFIMTMVPMSRQERSEIELVFHINRCYKRNVFKHDIINLFYSW